MKRFKMSKKASKASFRKTAGPRSVQRKNFSPTSSPLMRGGIRL